MGSPKPCEGNWVVKWVTDETQDCAIFAHKLALSYSMTALSMWYTLCSIQRLQHVASSVSYFIRGLYNIHYITIYSNHLHIKCRPDMTSAPH